MIGRDSTSVHTGHRRSGSLGTGSESSGTPHRKVSGHHRTISVDNSRNVTGQTPVRSPRRSSPYSITGPPASGVLSPREARRLSASSPIQERRKSQDTAAGQEPEPEANFAETNPENEAVSPRKRSLQDLNLPKGIRLRKVPSNSGTMNMMSSADTEGDPALMSEAVNPTLPTPVAEKSLGHGVYSSDTAVPAADSLSRGEACPAAMDIDDSANTLTDRTQVQQTSPLPPQEAADTAEPMDLSRPPSPPESITHVGAMPPADGASMVKRSSSNPPEPSMRPNHMNVDMLTSPETSKSPKGMSEFGHSRHQSPPHQLEQEPVGHAPLAKPEDSDIKPSSIAQPSVTARGPKSPTKMKSKAKGTGLSWLTKPEDTEAIVSAATARVSPARSRKLSNKRGKGLSTARSGTVTSAHPPPPSPQPPPVVELPKPPVVLMQAKRKVEDDDVYDEEESPVATPSPMAELVLKQPLVVIPTEPSPPKGPAILAAKSKAEASPKRKSRKKKDTIEKGIPTQQQPPSNSSHVIHQSSHQAQSTHRRTMSAPKIDPGMETLATAAMLAEKQQEHDLHSRRRASLAGTAYAPQGHVGVGSAHAPIPASYSMYAIGPGEHPSHRRHPSQHQLPHSQPLPAHHRPPSPQGPPHSQLPPHYYYPGHPAAPAGPDQRRYSAVQPVGHPYAYPPQHRGSVPQGVPLVPMHPGHPYWPGPGGRGPYYLPFPPPDGSAYPRYGAAQQSPQVQPGMPAAQDHRQRGYYDVNGHGHGDRESVSKRPTIAPHGYPTEEHREYPQQHTDSSAATNTTGVNQQSERHSTVPTKRRSAWLDVVLGDDA
ncbi:hypothetical protein BC832DRAFT_459273 [Gaertneriomyces semiglobifer]|nr:hypothetical protein BC832DRAFT_459273 [Gaertneriomyces semiglobifer]